MCVGVLMPVATDSGRQMSRNQSLRSTCSSNKHTDKEEEEGGGEEKGKEGGEGGEEGDLRIWRKINI